MSNELKKKFLFLGFAIPDDEMSDVFICDELPSIQTHKFNWNIIRGIEKCDEHDYTYISARPVSDFPRYPIKIIKGREWNVNIGKSIVNIKEIPFLNGSILKVITRFFSSFYFSIKNYHKVSNKGGVIVYSVHFPFMLTGLFISKLYRIDFIGIWTDPPSVSFSTDSKLKSFLRNLELCMSKLIMRRVSRVIVLTKYLAEDFAPTKPFLIVEGITDNNELVKESKVYSNSDYVTIIYTGSLQERYGIGSLVKGFTDLDEKNVRLEIYGRGDYESELLNYCKCDSRIKYGGFKSNVEILEIQKKADFLINTRSSDEEYVKYSFPSKTLEYLMSGTPVITTLLPGIPEEYKEFLIILDDNKPETISSILKKAINLTISERKAIGDRAKEFAKSKGFEQQGIRISRFLNKI